MKNMYGYAQYEYVNEELADMFALADIVVSRAGANSICEIVALSKPNILIPLPLSSSRGDQILNAKSFVKQGFSEMLEEENMTDSLFLKTLYNLYYNREKYIQNMKKRSEMASEAVIMELICNISK